MRAFASALLDHLVCTGGDRDRHFEVERLGGFHVDDEFVLDRRLHWKVRGLRALENAIHVPGGAPVLFEEIGAVGDETASIRKKAGGVDRWQAMFGRQSDDQVAMDSHRRSALHDQAAVRPPARMR